jgi:hypothetical protein
LDEAAPLTRPLENLLNNFNTKAPSSNTSSTSSSYTQNFELQAPVNVIMPGFSILVSSCAALAMPFLSATFHHASYKTFKNL